MKKERSLNIELLRIVAILFITLSHIPCSENPNIIIFYIHQFLVLGGAFGVNIFVIIGAFYLKNMKFSYKRITRLISQVIFYSLVLTLICFAFEKNVGRSDVIIGFKYWYPLGYVFMLLVYPLLSRLSDGIKNFLIILMFIMMFSFFVLGVFINPESKLLLICKKGILFGPIWFSMIYVFMEKFGDKLISLSHKKCIYFFMFIVMYVSMYIIQLFSQKEQVRNGCSPFSFFAAICIFLFFYNIQIDHKYSFILKLSNKTFAIYLVQCHLIFGKYIWNGRLNFSFYSENNIVLWCLFSIMLYPLLLIIASFLEYIRKSFLYRPL